MKKKIAFIFMALFASIFLFSCDEEIVPTTTTETKIHDRGEKDNSSSDIKLPDVIIPKSEEPEDNPTPTEYETIDSSDAMIDFNSGSTVQTSAGTGYSEPVEDGEMLYATTNIGYEFIGWVKDNKILSKEKFFKATEDGVYAAYKLKEGFENIIFTSTETECIVTGVKDDCPANLVIPEGVTKIASSAFNDVSVKFLTLPSTLQELEDSALYASNIYSVTFKELPKTIGDDVVQYSKIREIILPSGLKTNLDI